MTAIRRRLVVRVLTGAAALLVPVALALPVAAHTHATAAPTQPVVASHHGGLAHPDASSWG